MTLTSQGATKIYKTPNDHVEQYQTFNLSNQSYMEFVADPIIAYENAKFFQHNTFNLKEDSAMFYTDILTQAIHLMAKISRIIICILLMKFTLTIN